MLSIILPSYKGASILQKQLPSFIQFLDDHNLKHEIIIVNDGSCDGDKTKQVANDNSCVYIENKTNLGKGAGVRKGALAAKGDYICFTDVDIPFAFDDYIEFYDHLKTRGFDIVVGDRTLPESTYFTKISTTRKLGSDLFSAIVSHFFTDGLHDTQCGMKAFRRDVVMDLFSVARVNRFAFDVELISIAVKRNYSIKRLPVTFRCNDSKSVKVIQHGIGMLFDLVRIQWNHFAGKYKKIKISQIS
ncbi:MAG: glycosyltransferase [Bacteroidales bacterium]|nr:glycosyltransferase [Bacteroidales bacterium]MCF8457693.1 glycosyltransferase [Bacteroidales bacterium]